MDKWPDESRYDKLYTDSLWCLEWRLRSCLELIYHWIQINLATLWFWSTCPAGYNELMFQVDIVNVVGDWDYIWIAIWKPVKNDFWVRLLITYRMNNATAVHQRICYLRRSQGPMAWKCPIQCFNTFHGGVEIGCWSCLGLKNSQFRDKWNWFHNRKWSVPYMLRNCNKKLKQILDQSDIQIRTEQFIFGVNLCVEMTSQKTKYPCRD